MIKCPVCGLELSKQNNSFKCINNHSYDISKEGYVNLLLNYHSSGDNKMMVKSRNIVLNAGYFEDLALAIKGIIDNLNVNNLLDIGCGEGYYDAFVCDNKNVYGIDISKEAIKLASKRNKHLTNISYIVASMNDLPFFDKGFDLVLSIFSPIELKELKRVNSRYFLKVIPNKYHLIELKNELYQEPYFNEISNLDYDGYKLIKRLDLKYQKRVIEMNDLFKMTPYFYTTHNNYDLSLKENDVTFDFTICLYEIVK